MVDVETLRKILDYDQETGALTWKARPAEMFAAGNQGAEANANAWNARLAGKPALATLSSDGYLHGNIFNRLHSAHRVAWTMHYGARPDGEIDHINGDPADNRIANLRDVAHVKNMRNQKRRADNSSGATGVDWQRREGKWRARIKVDGRDTCLGYFTDFDAACASRKAAEAAHGFSLQHGSPSAKPV